MEENSQKGACPRLSKSKQRGQAPFLTCSPLTSLIAGFALKQRLRISASVDHSQLHNANEPPSYIVTPAYSPFALRM